MKQKILGAGLLGFALVACSSTTSETSRSGGASHAVNMAMSNDAAFEQGKTYLSIDGGAWTLTDNSRDPASSPTVSEEPASKSFSVGPDGGTQRFTLAVPRVMRWSEQVPVQRTRYENRTFVEDGYCPSYECDSDGGQSVLWNAFYSAPKERKAAALADAIKGIGDSSAQKLVAGGYFHRKPRSWSAFSGEIERAERAGVIDSNARYATLVQYRLDNLINLGYSESSCRVVQKRCQQVVVRTVPVEYTDYETRQYSKIVDTVVRDFEVTVRDSKLQPFETDSITVTAGQQLDNVRVAAGPFTRYATNVSHEGQRTSLTLVGQERIPVSLPNSIIVSGLIQPGHPPSLKVILDRRYVPAANGDDQLVLSYKVSSCKLGAFNKCWKKKTVIDQGIVPVKGETVEVKLVKATRDSQIDVAYSVQRRNSVFYTDNWVSERTTDEFKWK